MTTGRASKVAGNARLVLVASLVGVCACRSDFSKPPAPVTAEVAAVDATSPPIAISADAAAPAAATEPAPPTGEYLVTARVISSDCKPAYAPPAPWRAIVQAGAEKGAARVNIPLIAIPPSNALSPDGRSEVVVEPRKTTTHTWIPMPACSSYKLTRTLDYGGATANGFKVSISVDHGDGTRCSSFPPTRCTTKVEHEYALVRSLCPAECTRGMRMRGALDADVDCRCP